MARRSPEAVITDLAAKGLRVLRITWHQIVNEPEAMLVRLGRVIAAE